MSYFMDWWHMHRMPCMGCGCTACVCHRYYSAPKTPHKCPVCDGQGKLNKPHWVPGDQQTWTDSQTGPHQCHACSGSGVLWS